MERIQGWPSKGTEGLGPNLSLFTFKIHILKPWVAITRRFPKANFILGHPVVVKLLPQLKIIFVHPSDGGELVVYSHYSFYSGPDLLNLI